MVERLNAIDKRIIEIAKEVDNDATTIDKAMKVYKSKFQDSMSQRHGNNSTVNEGGEEEIQKKEYLGFKKTTEERLI